MPHNKPTKLYLVRNHDAELRQMAALWRHHARRVVEHDMRRKGVKPSNVSYAELQRLISDWIADHPRPTNT